MPSLVDADTVSLAGPTHCSTLAVYISSLSLSLSHSLVLAWGGAFISKIGCIWDGKDGEEGVKGAYRRRNRVDERVFLHKLHGCVLFVSFFVMTVMISTRAY